MTDGGGMIGTEHNITRKKTQFKGEKSG